MYLLYLQVLHYPAQPGPTTCGRKEDYTDTSHPHHHYSSSCIKQKIITTFHPTMTAFFPISPISLRFIHHWLPSFLSHPSHYASFTTDCLLSYLTHLTMLHSPLTAFFLISPISLRFIHHWLPSFLSHPSHYASFTTDCLLSYLSLLTTLHSPLTAFFLISAFSQRFIHHWLPSFLSQPSHNASFQAIFFLISPSFTLLTVLLRTHLLEVPGRRVAVVVGRSGGGGGRGWAPGAAPLPSLVWTVSAVIRRCLPFPPHPIIPMVGGGCWRGCGRRSHLPAEDSLKVYHWQHCWVKAVSVLREGREKDQVRVTGNTTGSKLSISVERGGGKDQVRVTGNTAGSKLSVLREGREKDQVRVTGNTTGSKLSISVERGGGKDQVRVTGNTAGSKLSLSVERGEGKKPKCGSLATLQGQSCLSVLREGRGKRPSAGHWQHCWVKAVFQCWERGGENQAQVTGNTTGSKLCLIMIQTSFFSNGYWENSFTLNVGEGRGEEGNIPVSSKK